MGTNTGIGIGIGIPFKNNALGGDRPYLPPELKARLIGVWDNYGKKNTDADRNIIKNKIPNAGGDLEILNAAYKLNSGFGKYKEDFTSWRIYPNIEVTDNVITTNGNFNLTWFIYKHSSESKINEMNIKVSGIPKGEKILYLYISDETANLPIAYTIPKDGIYHLPESKINNNRVSVGFTVESRYDWNNIRIEQIPSFEGAFVTDGIDDLITSTKTVQEMGITDEVTVVSMIHQIDLNSTYTIATTNYIENSNSREHVRSDVYNYGKTGIYGYSASLINNTKSDIKNILGDEADYYVKSTNSLQTIFDAKFSVVGRISELTEASQVAWYWTIIANKVLTTDEINQVIAYYNLDRTLKPDILCNTIKQGITNENHAEFGDKLIDFSGNGRDIQLNNIAWKGDSGIGKYETDFLDSSIWNYKTNSSVTSDKIVCNKAATHIMLLYYSITDENKYDVPSFNVLKQGDASEYYYIDEQGIRRTFKLLDGINTLPASHGTLFTGIEATCGFGNPGIGNSVTITQIPSHAGGLCLDGVNDFGKVTGMPIYKDYTVVTDREIFANIGAISSKNNPGAFVEIAGNSVYSFGQATSGLNFISTRSISYLSKYSYCGQSITAGAAEDGTDMWLGTMRDNDTRFFNGAIYSLMSFPYSMSEFLIERQLKKHKLGTLYPNMVEFRPIIKSNVLLDTKPTFVIRGTSTYLNAGDYVPKNSQISVSIKMNNIADRITKFTVNGKTINIPENAYSEVTLQYGFPFVIDKSPQKIGIIIEQDENYVLFNPVINSNVEYHKLDFYLNNYQKRINIGDYIPKGAYLRANFYLKNNVDELTVFTFNGVNIGYRKSSVDDTAFNIAHIYNYDSPQEVNITIDEYIRFEDIVQPYPVLLRFKDENGNEVSWGGKFRVGSTITRIGSIADPESNLLNGLYSISGLSLNGKAVTSSTSIVEKQMVFRTTATWLLDNNEPKVILSPRLLRIPNSSYKILGYIPDISGHGNNGVIHNSAYAEGSGVNEDGSYQFDGVDDFVTIPTTVGGKQVLMKVNWQKSPALLYDQRASGSFAVLTTLEDDAVNPRIAYQARNQNGKTYIDGIENNNIETYTLKDITHNITIANSSLEGIIVPVIGCNTGKSSNFAKMSLYDFMLFDDISTEDKIKELNEYIGIEAKVELPPYYWDTYGKTNFDADRDTIQQRGVAVGDYDLTNYNHAYEGMSGYNGYPIILSGTNRTYQNKASYANVVGDDKNVINLTSISFNTASIFSYVKRNGVLTSYNKDIESFKIKVIGIDYSRFVIKYNYISEANATAKTTMTIASDGIYELPKSFASDGSLTSSDVWIGINFTKQSSDIPDIIEDVNVTIEVLPEYENGLVYDGITDYSKNSNIPALDDFTAIIKREWLKKQGCPLIKGSKVYEGGNGNALLLEWDKAYNFVFYKRTDIMEGELPENISFITPTNYNGNVITRGSEQDTNGICIAGDGNAGFANMIFYKLILYPKTIPLLQINFLKNLMERDEIIDLTNPIFIKDE